MIGGIQLVVQWHDELPRGIRLSDRLMGKQYPAVNAVPDDHHFLREDRAVRWQRIAGLVRENPDNLDIALENIARWLALGRVHPAPLVDWKKRIHDARKLPEAFAEFIEFLAAPNHDSFPIKSCSPFVGLEPAQPIR